ncbi:heterokaryon incompatibility protein-domain-containing protein [Ampelomyces quisqualis]|uniref:Heterokaryon incompatibility protein-domain-containing protein n=1 Tax=Ampelomyces quisqualis TaxID=50730 RepID=A0A6A5R2Y4_AMPQU|nr:heterokaryon incompatibility protein-domain-containing protein [Ampelomyces quisqualis]
MAPYRYLPLDASKNEIRMVHLQPGSYNEPIRVNIEHIPFQLFRDGSSPTDIEKGSRLELENLLESWSVFQTLEGRPIYFCSPTDGTPYTSWRSPNATSNKRKDDSFRDTAIVKKIPRFEAVSYTWGPSAPQFLIEVVDASIHLGTLSIGSNLHEILSHLRRPSTPRTLWIDAISLNQEDTFEKSAQLRRIGDVFISEDAKTALEALAHVGKQIEYSSDDYFLPSPDCTEPTWWTPETAIPLSQTTWTAIAQLIRCPYFERLWVIQEIQLAGAFIRCRHEMTSLPQLSSLSTPREQRFADYLSRSLQASDMRLLFEHASDCQCRDPRDKVFAILGLLPRSMNQGVQPQYILPVEDIYIQAFLAAIDVTRRLDLLNTSNWEGSMQNHPSWAPAFTQSIYERYTAPANTLAASFSAAKIRFESPDQLHVLGAHHGNIKAVTGIITTYKSSDYAAILELYSKHLPKISTADFLDAYVWCLCQGTLSDRWHDYSLTPSLKGAKDIIKQSWSGANEIAEIYRYWFAVVTRKQQPHRFFMTDQGCLGCGPPDIAPGDQVCVFLGYGCPIVLRSSYTAGDLTLKRFMRPVYIHGLMEGQALLGPLPDSWDLIIDHRIKKSRFSYYHRQSGGVALKDPRLEDLPSGWQEVDKEDEARLRFHVQHHRNKVTGEFINSDPRLLPEALEARGVQLNTFVLI